MKGSFSLVAGTRALRSSARRERLTGTRDALDTHLEAVDEVDQALLLDAILEARGISVNAYPVDRLTPTPGVLSE